jgi:hypothetical protein
MFYGYRRSYKSDDFTPAAFVTQAANLTEDERLKIDLLPRVKHKVLLVSECGTLFRGKVEARAELFKILTRVLDGVGYRRDAGTAGGRGYDGDYLWGWIGGTTEVSDDTWKIMSNLGSRLFFCRLPNGGMITADDLVNSAQRCEPYKVRLARCSNAVAKFMNDLDARYGFRGKSWNLTEDNSHILKWIARLSLLIATLRGMNRSDNDEEAECPYRAFNILVNVACAHALVHGRERLTLADVLPVVRLVVGSVPRGVSKLLVRLLTIGPFNKKEAQLIIRPRGAENMLKDNVKRSIDILNDAGVIQWNGHQYCPTEEYSWSNPLEFKEIMATRADFEGELPL